MARKGVGIGHRPLLGRRTEEVLPTILTDELLEISLHHPVDNRAVGFLEAGLER